MKARNVLIGFLGFFTILWCLDTFYLNPLEGALPWVARRQGIYLTGLLSIALMSLVMVLATRPAWLEDFLGGMDKIYSLHKWAGIWAIIFAVGHWFIKLTGSYIFNTFGAEGKPGRDAVLFFLTDYRGISKDLGLWVVYFLIAALAVTLIKAVPYKQWRKIHKVMPFVYLVLVFHTVALTPEHWWFGFSGIYLAIALIAGSVSAFLIIADKIGASKTHLGTVVEVKAISDDILSVKCDAGEKWNGHVAGQFAFLKFDEEEGYHPFTIASAPEEDSSIVEFKIKALGDYTNKLKDHLHANQMVTIEGPYGKLDHKRYNKQAKQIWIAAGIGVTPFLAWLGQMKNERQGHIDYAYIDSFMNPGNEQLAKPDDGGPIEFHYCVKDAKSDPFVQSIKETADKLPNVNLVIHDASKYQILTAQEICSSIKRKTNTAEVWFCGPNGLAQSIRNGFKRSGLNNVTMHQEAFEMR